MNIFKFSVPELPGSSIVVAVDAKEAHSIHDAWYEDRFQRPCRIFEASKLDPLEIESSDLQSAMQTGQAGVASWLPNGGWVITPPDMELPGYRWLDDREIRTWEISAAEECLSVFAASPADAVLLFTTWWELHIALPLSALSLKEVSPESLHPERGALLHAMRLGAIGIGSDIVDEWKIMMPYDPAAGDL